MRCLDSIINTMDTNLSTLREIVKDRETWHATVHGSQSAMTKWLNNNNVYS